MNYNFNIEVPNYTNIAAAGVSNDGIYKVTIPVELGILYSFGIRSLPGINGYISLSIEDNQGNTILPMGSLYNKAFNNGFIFVRSGSKYILYGDKIEVRYPEISYNIVNPNIVAKFIVLPSSKFYHMVMINMSIIPDNKVC